MKYQIHILNATDNDESLLNEILTDASDKFHLFDNTFSSRAAGTIRSYSEAECFGSGFGARRQGNLIILDFNPTGPHPEKLEEIYQFVQREFDSRFPGRFKIPASADFISVDHSVPITEEARQRTRDFFKRKSNQSN